jgi:integrase
LLPSVTLGLFAGLRICELKRLDWSAIKMDDGHIVLGPEVVKRITEPRNVDILPNLAAWLRPMTEANPSGPVVPAGFRQRRDALIKFMKIEDWPDNGLRHSFASYHLVKFDNAQLTQLQMGQQTPSVLFKHYRQVVSRKDAERYWKLFPAAEIRPGTAIEAAQPQREALAVT